MENYKVFAIIAAVSFLFFMPIAHAGSIVTVVDAVNANGSIGLYLRNELGTTIYTDNSHQSTNVLTFTVNGTNYSINSDKSALELPKEITKFVVLNKDWPSGGYYRVDITYKDIGGGLYPKDSSIFFAKPPLSLPSYSTTPSKVLSNYTRVILSGKVLETGEDAASDITVQLASMPKYFILSDTKLPGSLSKGATTDFSLTFDRDTQTLPGTIIYTTLFVPMVFTYKSFGFESTQTFNLSFVIYNAGISASQSPKMTARIAVPDHAVPGQKIAVPVYVWNSNVEGNAACNINMTLSADSPDLSIPTSMLAASNEFRGRVEETTDPTTTFTMQASDSIKSGNYNLTLNIGYEDCVWKLSDYAVKRETLTIQKEGETVAKPNVAPPATDNTTTKSPIVNVSASAPAESKGIPSIYVTILAILGVALLFGLIYFLEFRSRAIY